MSLSLQIDWIFFSKTVLSIHTRHYHAITSLSVDKYTMLIALKAHKIYDIQKCPRDGLRRTFIYIFIFLLKYCDISSLFFITIFKVWDKIRRTLLKLQQLKRSRRKNYYRNEKTMICLNEHTVMCCLRILQQHQVIIKLKFRKTKSACELDNFVYGNILNTLSSGLQMWDKPIFKVNLCTAKLMRCINQKNKTNPFKEFLLLKYVTPLADDENCKKLDVKVVTVIFVYSKSHKSK